MVSPRARLDRLAARVAAAAGDPADPPKEVWLPVKDGGTEVPGRYPQPGGRFVVVLYAADDPDPNPGAGDG